MPAGKYSARVTAVNSKYSNWYTHGNYVSFTVQEDSCENGNHSFGAWTELNATQHQRICSKDSSHVEKADHTWNTGTITKPATATESGKKTYTCTLCGATREEIIPIIEVPVIKTQPVAVSKPVGETASFMVGASGTGLAYQWQCSTNNGKTWTNSGFATANSATLQIPVTAARNGYKYRCVVTGSDGQSVTSSAAALTVLTKITSQPAAVSAAVDETAAFTVNATGVGLAYQWQSSADNGKTWTDSKFSTAKAATLKVPVTAARNGYKYRCVVTGSNGKKATSSAAGLTVKTTVTAKPASVKKAVGDTVAFIVEATGPKLTYQWQSSIDNGKTWTNSGFSTAKTAPLKVPVTAARNGYKYRCKVTGANGSVTSSAATLTVLTKITAQPASVKKAVGATASFKVEATGVKLTYQWQYSTDGTTWKNSGFSTAKDATLKVPVTSARDGYMYRCVISDSNGNTVTSDAAALAVQAG